MADLVALPYMSEVFCATSNGNIAKTVAMNVIWFSLGMIIVSQFCPAMTQIAIEQGVNLADYNAAGVSIVSFGVLCHPFIVGLFAAFWFQNYIAIAIIIVVYVVLYVLFKKNRYTFVDWMENRQQNISYKYIKNDNLIIKQSTKRATAFPRRQLPDLF